MDKPQSEKLSRRMLFQYGAAGLIGLGGYRAIKAIGQADAQTRNDFEVEPTEMGGIKVELPPYILLSPQKLGGGTHAVNLRTNKQIAWISFWNYGDTCPISHHLCAYPADDGKDPYNGFEFVNSAQGGENVLLYGIPTRIKEFGLLDPVYGQGNQIYRVRYDGKTGQMELMENVAETTGIGLGVHTNVYPDASGFSCADGQKDVAAFFTRARGPLERTSVLAAFRADWAPRSEFLGETWLKGGTIRLQRLTPSREKGGGLHSPDGYYNYRGTTGNKINYEMAPMAELLVERGQIPGASPHTLTGLDFALHDPRDRFSVLGLRMCAGGIIVDRKNWEPVCFISADEKGPANHPLKKVSSNPDTWEVVLNGVSNPIHESGFNPSLNPAVFCMMNNLRANNVAVFDVKDADPRKWTRPTFLRDKDWTGEYPSPFHIGFSVDGSKCFFSVLRPKPMRSDIYVADTKSWKVIRKFRNVGVDLQTLAISPCGKFVFAIFSGFQRLESGVFAFRQDTLEPLGYMPNFGGHHDCVLVPKNNQELVFSRVCQV
jgi:thiocyanate desulfurase